MDNPHVYTVAEAARLLTVSRPTLYQAIKRGEVPSLRLCRRLVIPRSALERLLAGEPGSHEPRDAA